MLLLSFAPSTFYKSWFSLHDLLLLSLLLPLCTPPVSLKSHLQTPRDFLQNQFIQEVTDGGSKGMSLFTSGKPSLWEENMTQNQWQPQKSNFRDAHLLFLMISLGWEWAKLSSFNSTTNEWCIYLVKQPTIHVSFLPHLPLLIYLPIYVPNTTW